MWRRRARDERLAALSRTLGVLASPTRLALLHALREPRALHEIRAPPSRTRGGERAERLLSRQAVAHHLRKLAGVGVVRKLEGERYLLDRAQLFGAMEAVRDLAKLRAAEPAFAEPAATQLAARPAALDLPPPPRLHVVDGPDDGTAVALAEGGRWTIGRDDACDVILDHDLLVSARHAEIERAGSVFRVRDLGSRNGTRLSWEIIEPHAWRALPPGALLRVGRTALVLEA